MRIERRRRSCDVQWVSCVWCGWRGRQAGRAFGFLAALSAVAGVLVGYCWCVGVLTGAVLTVAAEICTTLKLGILLSSGWWNRVPDAVRTVAAEICTTVKLGILLSSGWWNRVPAGTAVAGLLVGYCWCVGVLTGAVRTVAAEICTTVKLGILLSSGWWNRVPGAAAAGCCRVGHSSLVRMVEPGAVQLPGHSSLVRMVEPGAALGARVASFLFWFAP